MATLTLPKLLGIQSRVRQSGVPAVKVASDRPMEAGILGLEPGHVDGLAFANLLAEFVYDPVP